MSEQLAQLEKKGGNSGGISPVLIVNSSLAASNSAIRTLNATFEVGKTYAIMFAYQWSNSCAFDIAQLSDSLSQGIGAGNNCYSMLYVGKATTATMKATVKNNVPVYYCVFQLD